MADRAVQRHWNLKRVSKAQRFLEGELKRRPAFLKGIEGRLAVKDEKLLVDGKQVVPKEEAMNEIKRYDDNPRYSGGRDRLYSHIARERVGITRNMVRDYIHNSEAHQLTRPKPAMVRHRAIIVKRPGAQGQVDLVEMPHDAKLNNDFVYILTYIDLFSKYGAARPLKLKEGPEVIAGLDSILSDMKAEHRPRVLQSDNGSEFGKAFEVHMKQKWGESNPFFWI